MENRAILIGRIGSDPEKKVFVRKDGTEFSTCKISLATSETWINKDTKEPVTDTQWHRVVFYGHYADQVYRNFHKSDLVYVSGKITYRDAKKNDPSDLITYKLTTIEVNPASYGYVRKIINQQKRNHKTNDSMDDSDIFVNNKKTNFGAGGSRTMGYDDLDNLDGDNNDTSGIDSYDKHDDDNLGYND